MIVRDTVILLSNRSRWDSGQNFVCSLARSPFSTASRGAEEPKERGRSWFFSPLAVEMPKFFPLCIIRSVNSDEMIVVLVARGPKEGGAQA